MHVIINTILIEMIITNCLTMGMKIKVNLILEEVGMIVLILYHKL